MAPPKKSNLNVAIAVAIIGLVGTIITAFLGYLGIKFQTEKPISASQTAQTTQSIAPTLETTVSTGQFPMFDLDVLPGPGLGGNGLITVSVDRITGNDKIDEREIDKTKWITTISPELPTYFEIILTGKNVTPAYITNRIPIKVVSYEQVPIESDIWIPGGGGGNYIWVFSTEFHANTILLQDSIIWASYPVDLIKRFDKARETAYEELPVELRSFPTSIQNIYLDKSATLPDFFTLSENELLVMGIGAYFTDPGIYTIKPGIEFVVDGQRNIKWADKPIEIYVPNDFTFWMPNYQDGETQGIKVVLRCTYEKENGHVCP